ncbi:MAG: M15 family metallopeptidase, partial [Treponema sp.]|nr:M15 family metallopeptidase [Treponema sp.]
MRIKLAMRVALPLLLTGALAFAQNQGDAAMDRAELALRSLQEGFPDRVGNIAFMNGDWTVRVSGQLFYWAEGRLLPEAVRHRSSEFAAHSFYVVPDRPPEPREMSPERVEQLRNRSTSAARSARVDPHRGLQAALYGGDTRAEIEALQRKIAFLGFQITVHRDLVAPLQRIETEIRAWSGGAAFIASLESAYGFNWRQIAGTQRMSYHSWGLAIDILPRSRAL